MLTGIPHSFPNAVLRTQVEPDHADTIIEKTLAHLRSRNATKLSWWVESDSRPVDLGRNLTTHGLTYVEGGPGMAADLLALNEELTLLSDLTIEPVRDTGTLRQWAYASINGFGLPETSIDIWFNVFAGLGFELPLRNYVGILERGAGCHVKSVSGGRGSGNLCGGHYRRGTAAGDWSGNDVSPAA